MADITDLFKNFINSVLNNYDINVNIEKKLNDEESDQVLKNFFELINGDPNGYRFFCVINYKYLNEVLPKILVSDMKENNYFLHFPLLTDDYFQNNILVNDSIKFEYLVNTENLNVIYINKLKINYSYIFNNSFNSYEIKFNKNIFFDFTDEKLSHRIINL